MPAPEDNVIRNVRDLHVGPENFKYSNETTEESDEESSVSSESSESSESQEQESNFFGCRSCNNWGRHHHYGYRGNVSSLY